jgi:hypothetical protein
MSFHSKELCIGFGPLIEGEINIKFKMDLQDETCH